MRTSAEIHRIFTEKGCTVHAHDFGHSYHAGGEIFIYAPGLDPKSKDGFDFVAADFGAFDGTGYAGRGRRYRVWLVKPGDYVPATAAEFALAPKDRRYEFGSEQSDARFFVRRDELAKNGLADMAAAFAALGI